MPSSKRDTDSKITAPIDYLEKMIEDILCGRSVRDLPEAIGAVRHQIEEQRLTNLGLFDDVCAVYEQRIAEREELAEIERQSARNSKILVGCVCLIIGLLAGSLLSL